MNADNWAKKAEKNDFFLKKTLKTLASSKISSNFAAHLEIVLWCNGSTPDSGSVCVGSNPTRTTKKVTDVVTFFNGDLDNLGCTRQFMQA